MYLYIYINLYLCYDHLSIYLFNLPIYSEERKKRSFSRFCVDLSIQKERADLDDDDYLSIYLFIFLYIYLSYLSIYFFYLSCIFYLSLYLLYILSFHIHTYRVSNNHCPVNWNRNEPIGQGLLVIPYLSNLLSIQSSNHFASIYLSTILFSCS